MALADVEWAMADLDLYVANYRKKKPTTIRPLVPGLQWCSM
jgi:hypothetical protein